MKGTEYYFEEGCYIRELLNAVHNPDVSVVRARVEPGVTTRCHRLNGITERYIIIEGCGRVEVGSEPARDIVAGDVVHIPAMCSQRITNTGEDDLVFLAVCTPRFTESANEDIQEKVIS